MAPSERGGGWRLDSSLSCFVDKTKLPAVIDIYVNYLVTYHTNLKRPMFRPPRIQGARLDLWPFLQQRVLCKTSRVLSKIYQLREKGLGGSYVSRDP